MTARPNRAGKSRGRAWLKLLVVFALVFSLVAVLWVVLLPSFAVTMIRSRTGFAVKVDKLSVNPFTGRVAIAGLVVKNPAGWPVDDFVELREFRADANLFSFFSRRIVADEVVVDLAKLTLVKNQQGRYNVAAFQEGFAGKEKAGAPPATAASPSAKQEFLIKHLVLRFDTLVVADLSGRKPLNKEYSLNLARDMRDVDSVTKIISPITGNALGLVTDALGGIVKVRPDVLKDATEKIQEAGRKTGEKLKGLLDSLDKTRP